MNPPGLDLELELELQHNQFDFAFKFGLRNSTRPHRSSSFSLRLSKTQSYRSRARSEIRPLFPLARLSNKATDR